MPEFAAGTLEALTLLAERATRAPAGRRPFEVRLAATTLWLSKADVDEAAARYPDLALTLLKARDERSYAA
jgi:hypothetical protein